MFEPAPDMFDRDGADAVQLLEGFDAWLTARLAEARAAGMDLAFFDSELRVIPGARPALVGWDYVLLAPGVAPPTGQDWTVYRLAA